MAIINGHQMAWMRILRVTFTSKKYNLKMIFTQDDLTISIEGDKYMGCLSDSCTIKINNLTYSEIVRLIAGEFYDVVVECGYEDSYLQTIFKGGVLYITNSLNDRKTTITTILCGSELVARFGQTRMNLSLQSGINIYTAVKFVCDRAGIPNSNVSPAFKTKFLQEVMNANDTIGNWIDALAKYDNSMISSSDGSLNSTVMIFDSLIDSQKIIKISENSIDLSGGYPQLDTSGLTLTVMPTMPFHCGEIIQLDPSYINIIDDGTQNTGIFMDPKGQYMIYEMHYTLENRGSSFSVRMLCKSRSLLTNVTSQRR